MAVIQLVAKGPEDLYLTNDPQITYFKSVFRRHTEFMMCEIQNNFLNTPDFGKKTPCIINNLGDLISNITLVITLPSIPRIYNLDESIDNMTRFAWIRKIGFGIIKNIEFKIGEMLIDNLYGDWINIWYELNNKKENNINNMIGNINYLYEYSQEKYEYKLFIPLPFWFSKVPSAALPLLCLTQNTVELNLELQDFSKCYKITPTHYILMDNDICQFKTDEYIVQKYDDFIAIGQFTFFDSVNKKLYYSQITKTLFKVCNVTNNNNDLDYNDKINKYIITGLTSKYFAIPFINLNNKSILEEHTHSITYRHKQFSNIQIKECFLLVKYIYLESYEKTKFYKTEHEYVIEQVSLAAETIFSSTTSSTHLNLQNPIKYLVWHIQQNYLLELFNNDLFNYTNSYIYNDILHNKIIYNSEFIENNIIYHYKNNGKINQKYNNKQFGNSLIKSTQLLLNATERFYHESDKYFNNIQSLNHFKYNPQNGIQVYSFAINPQDIQQSGSCNMSKIDNIQINLILDDVINTSNTALFKCYSIGINILRIDSGSGGLIFLN